jgi:hypothetical protein
MGAMKVRFALAYAICTRGWRCGGQVIVAHLVGDFSRKRKKADMIASPAWALEGRTFAAAIGAACTGTQFVG